MKSNIIPVTLGLCVALSMSASAFAAGTKINKSKIINKSTNKNVINAAIGIGSTANVGSINLKGAKINKSTIINKSSNKNVINAAIGLGSTSNTSSINID